MSLGEPKLFEKHATEADSAVSLSVGKSDEPPLKIALLGYRSDPFVGGQGIYLKHLSYALSKRGHTVHVYSGPPYPELHKDVTLFKVPSLDLYASDNHIRALRWRHLLSFTDFYEWWTMATGGFGEPYTFGRRVFKLLRKSDYDIIHDNQSLCSALVQLQSLGHNVVSTIHHPIHRDRDIALQAESRSGMRTLIKRWYSFLNMQERVVAKLANITTVSKQSQQDIETYFHRDAMRTQVIFNGIDTDVFQPNNALEKKSVNWVTTSSSDQPLKGLASLLRALAELKSDFPSITLDIVGELKENGENERLIKKLQLEPNVNFHKGIEEQQLVKLYNQATVVVCPSLYEGFGLPAAEAMACGAVVVSSDGGALPEVVGDAGLIYKAGDSAALENSIRNVFDNPDALKTLSIKARKRALEHFCWDRVAHALSDYYRTIKATPRDAKD